LEEFFVANHPSALKRHRQSRKRRAVHRSSKSRLNTLTRQLEESVEAGQKQQAQENLKTVSVALAKAASKGQIHAANASRKTSRLARRVAAMSS
jgi:small subunit ribosomal protein S20